MKGKKPKRSKRKPSDRRPAKARKKIVAKVARRKAKPVKRKPKKATKKPRKKIVRRQDVATKIDASPLGNHKPDGCRFHPLKLLKHHINELVRADDEMSTLKGTHLDHVKQRIQGSIEALMSISNQMVEDLRSGKYNPLSDPA